jgi:2-iminobutanoate/2-iminopropanoate deaminase
MLKHLNPAGVPAPTPFYSHCVLAPAQTQLLFLSGQVGVDVNGTVAPDFAGQIRQAWQNVSACLAAAGAGLEDLVQVRTYLVDGQDVETFQRVRREFMPREPPSSTVLFVPRLMSPQLLFEVEVVAALPQ